MSVFWSSLLWFLAGGIVGAAISFYFTKRSFEKQLRDNPPINEKMIRRHPHVFNNVEYASDEERHAAWEKIKKEEKLGREWEAA